MYKGFSFVSVKNINNVITRRPFQLMPLVRNYLATETSTDIAKPIIPLRVKRGPTDILKAIASTIQRDPTGPLYKFYDDPYLYPVSNMEKKTYALSKESGRKAAQWVRDTHAECFNHTPDDPQIKIFMPKVRLDENSEISDDDLLNSIKNLQVLESINLYTLAKSNNKELHAATCQALLELICFYNGEDAIDSEWLEEINAQARLKPQHLVKSWKEGGIAEELFEQLKDNGPEPYCAIIKGMAVYGQVDRAWNLYQESIDKKLILDTETFNALIRISPQLKEENQLRWEHIVEILGMMVQCNVPANLGTMNSILESLSAMRGWEKAKSLSLQVLSEFKQLNIEPSLATYYFLLGIYYTIKNSWSPLLFSILKDVKNQSFRICDPKDTLFFSTAMDICKRDLQSFEMAERVNELLTTGENYRLLGESIKERNYYRNYFILSVNSLPLDQFMKFYDNLTPHVYTPEREVMGEIVRNIGVYDDLKLLPRIWSDCILFGAERNEKLMEMVLMTINHHNLESVDSELGTQLANISWDIWTRIQNQSEKVRQKLGWSGQMLGDCISSLVRCNDFEKASVIFESVCGNASISIERVPIDTLKVLQCSAIENESYNIAFLAAKYAKDSDYPESFEMAKNLRTESKLSPLTRSKLVATFGSEVD